VPVRRVAYETLAEADLHPDWVAGIDRRHQFGDHRRQSADASR